MPAIRTNTSANADSQSTSVSTDGQYHPRLASSCVQCRARKIKCTSDKPMCANCIQTSQECEYRQRLKPGLKQGVGSELLQRVSLLEEALTRVNSRMADFSTRLDRLHEPQPPIQASMIAEPRSDGTWSANTQPAAPLSDKPVSTFSATPTGSVASTDSADFMPRPPQPPHCSHFGAQDRINGYSEDHHSRSIASTSRIEEPAPPSVLPEASSPLVFNDLPPLDLLLTLLDLFFIHVAPLAPFVRPDVGEVLRNTRSNEQELPILIYGIVVASLRFSFDPRWNNLESKNVYRERAKQKIILHSIGSISVASIEALMLVALDEAGANTTPGAWGALALTTRSAVHMSLHKEEEDVSKASDWRGVSPLQLLNRSTSHAEAEERRRLFWAIFVLDRWSATATGWDLAFADDRILRQTPCSDTNWLANSAEPTGLFVSPHQPLELNSMQEAASDADVEMTSLIEVTDLLGKVHQLHREKSDDMGKFREGTQALEHTLTRWFSSLPAGMLLVSPARPQSRAVLVQALYWATVIKLQSLLAYPLAPSLAPDPQAGEKAHEAAKQISYLAQASTGSSAYLSWAFFVGARMMLLRAYRRKEVIDPAIHDILRGLREAATYFDLAARHHTMISRAIKRQNSMDGSLGSSSALVNLHHTAFSAERAIPPSGDVTPDHIPAHSHHFHPQRTTAHGELVNAPLSANVNHHTTALHHHIREQTSTYDDLMEIASINADTGLQASTETPHTIGHSMLDGALPPYATGDVFAGPNAPTLGMLNAEASWWDNDLLGHSFASWFDLSISPTILDSFGRANDGTTPVPCDHD